MTHTTNDAPVTVEQLWCLHVMGPDEVHPAPDRAMAQLWAVQWTVYWHGRHPDPRRHDPVMSWVVAPWPHDAASHADGLTKSIADNTWPIDPLAALASTPAGVNITVRQKDPVVADYGDNFLVAHVSADGKTVGIDHPCDAVWSDVDRAQTALRDYINERIAAQDKCPFKPRGNTASAPAGDGVEDVRAANPIAKNDCPSCHGLGTVLIQSGFVLCRVPGCPAVARGLNR